MPDAEKAVVGIGAGHAPTIDELVARRTKARESYYDALEALHLDIRDSASRRQIKRAAALCDDRRDRLVDASARVQRAKADAYDRAHNDTPSDASNPAANGSGEAS